MNPQEPTAKINRDGTIFTTTEQRSLLLKTGMGFPVDAEAEWAVITGCYNLLLFAPVFSFGKLLQHFDVSFTFLSKEYCCGHPLVTDAQKQHTSVEEMRFLGFGGKEGLTRNREDARKLGVKGMITICPGCRCMSQEYDSGSSMEYMKSRVPTAA